ncbi:MAG: response regulator transcription factor [Longimicrobiales bacterium]
MSLVREAVERPSSPPSCTCNLNGKAYSVYASGASDGGADPVVVVLVPEAEEAEAPAPHWRAELTERELDVARLIACRRTTKEIAATLGIAWATARRHTEQVLAKLGVDSRYDVHRVLR